MLSAISKKLTSRFILKGDIIEEERETYDYCFEIFLSTLLNSFFLLITGLVSGQFIYTCLFMLSFILFRKVSGGFHAKSHIKCFLTLVLVYMIFLSFLFFATDETMLVCSIIFTLTGVVLIYYLSPVEHPNNPLDLELKEKLAKKAKWAAVIFSVIIILFIALTNLYKIIFCLAYGMFSVAVSIAYVKISSHINKKI